MNSKKKEKTNKDDSIFEDPPVLFIKGKKIVINEDLLSDEYLNGKSSYSENELKDVPYDDIYETILCLQKDPFRRVRSSTIFLNRIKAIRFFLTATLKALSSLLIEMFNDNSFTGNYIYQFSCIAEYTKEKRNQGNLQFSL